MKAPEHDLREGNKLEVSERLQQIKERADKATPEPWKIEEAQLKRDIPESELSRYYGDNLLLNSSQLGSTAFIKKPEDAEFIAHARADIPWLLSQFAAILEENQRLKEKLEFAEKDLLLKDCPNCHGSGEFQDSTEGGIWARCHCWANKVMHLNEKIKAAEEENQRLQNLSSLTYGELPERVQKLLSQSHIWDNKNISEQRDWAIEALQAAEAKLVKMRDALLAAKAVIMRDDDDAEIRLEEILGICNEAALAE